MPEYCFQNRTIKCPHEGIIFCVSPCPNCFVNKPQSETPQDIIIEKSEK